MSRPSFRRSAISLMLAIVLIAIIVLISLAAILYYTENEASVSPSIPLSSFKVERIIISNPSSDNRSGTISSSSLVKEGLVYIASTAAEQIQGFQNVTSFGSCNGLSTNESTQCIGMIFVTTSTQNLCFWMHDTLLPLQQVWISSSGKVVYIYQAQPKSDNSVCQTALDVLETSPNISISLGDVVSLNPI